MLEAAGLIRTETQKGRKGNQKLSFSAFDEVLVMFREDLAEASSQHDRSRHADRPLHELRSHCSVRSVLAEGHHRPPRRSRNLLNPDRMNAGLMWFTRGFVEYQFPNNARLVGKDVVALGFSFELSSEVPGTSADWPSDITIAINAKEVGVWTSPGDFGDKRGVYTPDWWKLKGSQYGKLKSWRVTRKAHRRRGRISAITPQGLDSSGHHSIWLRSRSSPTHAIPAASTSSAAGLQRQPRHRPQNDDRALTKSRTDEPRICYPPALTNAMTSLKTPVPSASRASSI